MFFSVQNHSQFTHVFDLTILLSVIKGAFLIKIKKFLRNFSSFYFFHSSFFACSDRDEFSGPKKTPHQLHNNAFSERGQYEKTKYLRNASAHYFDLFFAFVLFYAHVRRIRVRASIPTKNYVKTGFSRFSGPFSPFVARCLLIAIFKYHTRHKFGTEKFEQLSREGTKKTADNGFHVHA